MKASMVFLAFRQGKFGDLALSDVLLNAVSAYLAAIAPGLNSCSRRCPTNSAIRSHDAILHRRHIRAPRNFL
jgi:hypothetical protein